MFKIYLQCWTLSFLWRFQRLVNWLRERALYARDARSLNQQLLADVERLAPQFPAAQAKVRALCRARGYDHLTTQNWESHIYRLLLTAEWIAEILQNFPPDTPIQGLDLGAESIASDYWRSCFPNVSWENTDFDLRAPWKIPPASKDLLVCTEVIEHISDPVLDNRNDGFYGLGLHAMLQEAFKVLKPGGYFFLTTPNAASVLHLKLILDGNAPWFLREHVREYTLAEVTLMLRRAGFEIVRRRAIHCMSVLKFVDYTPIFRLLLENGFPVDGRGDDLFILARKPETGQPSLPIFDDVPETHWAWHEITSLAKMGIMTGMGFRYGPEEALTRAQLAVILEKVLHGPDFVPPEGELPPAFADVSDHWARRWISALKNDGLLHDETENAFWPDRPVSRAEAAVFLIRAKYGASFLPPLPGPASSFEDVPTDHWAAPWIEQMIRAGIITKGGKYRPDDPITRAEMAVFLVKAFNLS